MEIPAYHQLPLLTNSSIHPCWLPAGEASSYHTWSLSSGISHDPLKPWLDGAAGSHRPLQGQQAALPSLGMPTAAPAAQTPWARSKLALNLRETPWGRGSLQPGQGTLLRPESRRAQTTGSCWKSQDGSGWTGQCHVHSLATISCPSASFPARLLHFPAL